MSIASGVLLLAALLSTSASSSEPVVIKDMADQHAVASEPDVNAAAPQKNAKHHRSRGYRTHSLAFGSDGAGEVISPPAEHPPFSGLALGAAIFMTVWIACFAVSQFRAIAYDDKTMAAEAEADRAGLVAPR